MVSREKEYIAEEKEKGALFRTWRTWVKNKPVPVSNRPARQAGHGTEYLSQRKTGIAGGMARR